MEILDRMLSFLPYHLKNGENIKKYYLALAELFDELIQAFIQIQQSRDIDQSEWYGLDIIGSIVGENRNGLNDEDYRRNLKTKIISNRSDGSIEVLNNFGRLILGQFYNGVIKSSNPAELVLRYTFPLVSNPVEYMEKATAAGVNVKTELDVQVPICGTFILGSLPFTKTLVSS